MKKIFIHALILLLFFLCTWFFLSRIDWVSILNIRKVTDNTEKKLGELQWHYILSTQEKITNPLIVQSVDSLVDNICIRNHINREDFKVHILRNDEINAFALPDGYLIINSGLINELDSQEELCGVICHEIAHIQLKHIMKKLIKEFGLSVLSSMVKNEGGAATMKRTANILSSTAFDRKMEEEADIKAVEYLRKAHINPEALADFLYKLDAKQNTILKYMSWISTHPSSKDRINYITEYSKNCSVNNQPILHPQTWSKVKEEIAK